MGQQQLILLVLSTVIVGIAIVVGIRAFNENAIKSNSDAMIQDMVRIASDAQAWKQKPAPFGGQEGAAKSDPVDYTGATLPALGYAVNGNDYYINQNGGYTIVSADESGLVIEACSQIRKNRARITVVGITDQEISQPQEFLDLGTSNCTVPGDDPE